jgi:hypothetical protein
MDYLMVVWPFFKKRQVQTRIQVQMRIVDRCGYFSTNNSSIAQYLIILARWCQGKNDFARYGVRRTRRF